MTNRYLYADAIDSALAEDDFTAGAATSTDWLLGDHQGSIRDVVNESGTEETHIEYDSFGNILAITGTVSTAPRITYVGQEYDADTGLYYYWHRWYDATTGRFISTDPMGYAAGDVNLYRYVGNSPVIYIDPTGLSQALPTQMLSSLIAGSIGGVGAAAAAAYSTWSGGSSSGGWSGGGGTTSLQSLLGSSASALSQFSSGPDPIQWSMQSTTQMNLNLPNIQLAAPTNTGIREWQAQIRHDEQQAAAELAALKASQPTLLESLLSDVQHAGSVIAAEAPGYLKKSASQVWYGDYTDDVTALGTIAQLGTSFIGADLPGDIRDISASFYNWESTPSHALKTTVNVLAVLPVFGMLKYGDEVAQVARRQGAFVMETGAKLNADEIAVGKVFTDKGYDVTGRATASNLGIPGKRTSDLFVGGHGKVDVYTPKVFDSKAMSRAIEKKYNQAETIVVRGDLSERLVRETVARVWGKEKAAPIKSIVWENNGDLTWFSRPK